MPACVSLMFTAHLRVRAGRGVPTAHLGDREVKVVGVIGGGGEGTWWSCGSWRGTRGIDCFIRAFFEFNVIVRMNCSSPLVRMQYTFREDVM